MPKFSITNTAFVTTTGLKTLLKLAPAAAVNTELVLLVLTGSGSVAAADVQHEGSVNFLDNTGAGALSAQTPERIKQASRAAQGTYGSNTGSQTEPTTYSSVAALLFGFNQRNGFIWGVPEGQGILADASQTVDNLGIRVRSSAAGTVDCNAHVVEP